MRIALGIKIFLFILALNLLAGSAAEGEWASADGRISVVPPSSFLKGDALAPLVIVWLSSDQKIKLAVAEADNPKRYKLKKESMEKGLIREMNGTLLESIEEEKQGVSIFKMTCSGELSGQKVFCCQVIIGIDDKVYKVMAISFKQDPRQIPEVVKFMDSLKILKAK
ncbi:MAG TPA: hypothetical protein DCZ94_17910 [Lentisphaeria bacterium]|nr:MAG: hypothetical protein A2X48_20725 [Lentisphaerae bacterium GWF2_49_21]HBC88822.1 hypothetical protein [Lentisphaeria bacterium]